MFPGLRPGPRFSLLSPFFSFFPSLFSSSSPPYNFTQPHEPNPLAITFFNIFLVAFFVLLVAILLPPASLEGKLFGHAWGPMGLLFREPASPPWPEIWGVRDFFIFWWERDPR